MKKSTLFIVLTILLIILLFSVSALCNKKVTVDLSGMGESATLQQESSQNTESEGSSSPSDSAEGENSSIEQPSGPPEVSQDEDPVEQSEEDDEDEEELSAPSLKLEIYKDATYSSQDDVCFYRIKAIVTGNPKPEIDWSKDDSKSAFGNDIAQINLERGQTYTLTCTVENSSGSDTATMELGWGCD